MPGPRRYNTPGIYFEKAPEPHPRPYTLEKVPIDTTAFLGYAVRGPVGKPVRLTSWKSFETLFGGFSDHAYLPQAVFGFFANAGREAIVVRIARDEGEGAACPSSLTLKDLYGRPTLRVSAKDPGDWGRSIKVRVTGGSRPARTDIAAPLEQGATEASVDLTKGFEVGAVVRLSSGQRTEYVQLVEVSRKRIRWDESEALRGDYREAAVEGVELQVAVTSPYGFEIHDNLVFATGHSRDLVSILNERSNLISVEDLDSRTPSPFNSPQAETEAALQGGRDGLGKVKPADFLGRDFGLGRRTGLLSLEDVEEVGLICAPDLQAAVDSGDFGERDFGAVQQALVDYCERHKTAVAVLDVPRGFDIDMARDWRARFDTKYAAMYYPWFKVQDPTWPVGKTRLVPPCGHVAGLTSQVDQEHGVHRAAANLVLKDVVGLERDLPKDLVDLFAPEGLNAIRSFRGRGIRPWGARTLSSDKLWVHLPVRRLFIMVERAIADGCAWAVFEGNHWPTWKAVERQISTFLYKLWQEGALYGDVPEEAFYVRCDEELNPPEVRDVGEFHCEIGMAAVRPAEFIVFRIGQQAKDIITEEPVS